MPVGQFIFRRPWAARLPSRTALALHEEMLPGTVNLENPDPACDLDYMADGSKNIACEYAMCNSFGFGGTNASLILKKWDNK